MKIVIIALMAGITLLDSSGQTNSSPNTRSSDVIIYGGTSAAVTATVQLARMGNSVIMVSPDVHLGGMTSSGLGFTDTGNKEVIGGISREFYQRIYDYYQEPETWKWQEKEEYGNKGQGTPAMDGSERTMWIFEPHIAEQVFEDFIRESEIEVFRNEWLDREDGIVLEDGKIVSITTLSGQTFEGKVFIDATYEGDLMALAGVSYNVGREAGDVYNEEWNGVQVGVLHHGHHFGEMKISPYVIPGDPGSGVLPLISTDDPGNRGEGDQRLQAYCFRMCLTREEENRVPFTKPDGYDSTQFELLIRVLNAGWKGTFNKFDPIPNLKTDVNNHGPLSFDYIGMNYDYPEATFERRGDIIKQHETYQKGLLYFIATDPRIPEQVQNEMKKWGLAKDEFRDNGHWPYQIYVREARRMIGDFVMTENEIQGKSPVQHPVGMGSYTMDSHNTQRYITPEGYVQNEGDIGVEPEKPYQIDLGSILPLKSECKNLLVPVAVSCSHIAFGSIRMEPVFMILGQSAATVASLAVASHGCVQDIPYDEIKPVLVAQGQILGIPEVYQTCTYFENDSISLDLDIFLPDQGGEKDIPLVIFVHGGGFSNGDRGGGHKLAQYLTGRGIACASITYTLYMEGKDFGCDGILSEKIRAIQIAASQLWHATAFLTGLSEQFNIDTTRIFIAGSSAGAETVLHAAHWDRQRMQLFDPALSPEFRYAGIISGAGAIMDLNLITRENMIPAMVFHGDADPLVPYGVAAHHFCPPNSPGWLMLFGSHAIAEHLQKLGGSCQLITFRGGDHSFAGAYFYQNQQPVADFVDRVLSGESFNFYQSIESEKR
jgi:acetyl esterase/lipase